MKKFFYRVESSDTVFSVAEKFSVPPVALVKSNNLKREIGEGDFLYVEIPDRKTYRVKPNDTLTEIALKFMVSPEKIREDNGIDYVFYGLKIYV